MRDTSCQLRNPTCRAEEEDRWFTQEPVDLVSDCNLSVSEGGEGLTVGLTHGVINVIKQNGKGLTAQVWHLEGETEPLWVEGHNKGTTTTRWNTTRDWLWSYLSQLALEQSEVAGGGEDDVLTGGESVNKPQASGLGLGDEVPQLTWGGRSEETAWMEALENEMIRLKGLIERENSAH